MKQIDVLIIGAGAAGLMCAISAGKRGRLVVVLEKTNKIGKKIRISGGGRCNFTNLHTKPESYISNNPHFCKSALAQFNVDDFLQMMQKNDLSWHEKTRGQLFCNQKSQGIIDMLERECQNHGAAIIVDTIIKQIEHYPACRQKKFVIKSNNGIFSSTSLVVATGGPSIPKMGASDFGVQIAKQFGIKFIPFRPALVPFVFHKHCFRELSGLSHEVLVGFGSIQFREQMLITHRGLSGPACLQISSFWKKNQPITINLLPDLDAVTWALDLKNIAPKSLLKKQLSKHMSKRLAEMLIKILSNFADKPLSDIRKNELVKFAKCLNTWRITPDTTEGMRTAEVSLGGIDTAELSSKTCATKKIPSLYFVGETVDVTGWLGGYNFQWAWASGFIAGQSA